MSKFEINQTSGSFTINVNAILTLQLRPHAGQSDEHEAGTAESKSH